MNYRSADNQDLADNRLTPFVLAKLNRIKDLVSNFCGWVLHTPGKTLRLLTSRIICGQVGNSVEIGAGVELIGAKGIHLEDGVNLEVSVQRVKGEN